MAQIQGKYTIRAVLNASYEFTGNDRSASFGFASSSVINTICATKPVYGIGAARFLFENQISIRRARILAAGAEGLKAPKDGEFAASIIMQIRQFIDGSGPTLASGYIRFSRWGEWEEKNLVYRPYEGTPNTWEGTTYADKKPVSFYAIQQNSLFKCDDYDISSAFVGETFTPVLEMEIDTAGIIETSQGTIY